MNTRRETDALGSIDVPVEAYYGAQTARAAANFPISGEGFPRCFIQALGAIKHAAAEVNLDLGLLNAGLAPAIQNAAEEVLRGEHDDQFIVDIFETGSGTSTNMNANEVIAGRANELLTGARGGKDPVHPNDHVNLGQSSNDTIPTALHVAAVVEIEEGLLPAWRAMHGVLSGKARAWDDALKLGRTHLMDAMPIRFGQVAGGWARQVELAIERVEECVPRLLALPQGGTAVGTGIGAHPGFGARVADRLRARFGPAFRETEDHFEGQHSRDAVTELAGQLSTAATGFLKLANDVRWLASGPRGGFGELALPAVQPGSSIMPGKVNPVLAEALAMACAQVMGHAVTVQIANSHGNLELNVMMPVIAQNLLESVTLLGKAVRAFTEKAVLGMKESRRYAERHVGRSLALATPLASAIGYDRAAEIAKRAAQEDRTVLEICLDEKILPEEDLRRLLDPRRLTEPEESGPMH